ncbi:muconolactone Delta-isomerase family protein [Agromyces soli]|uniref:Muconolactone Delta-isomerase family protein n=1 Tax=Agromyces soli TaxID=659012 RepID=A0ABY4AVH7_9MICO|nr:muconolactone Delta-isomerase family protein [Agromyces soli]UOE27175.1 muconolactone Delta-isomerase family protein [Agromyces soli]
MAEYLVRLTIGEEPPAELAAELRAAEAERAAALARDGALIRLWRPEGQAGNIGLWRAENVSRLREHLASLPLAPYLRTEVMPLEPHPYDPAGEVAA